MLKTVRSALFLLLPLLTNALALDPSCGNTVKVFQDAVGNVHSNTSEIFNSLTARGKLNAATVDIVGVV